MRLKTTTGRKKKRKKNESARAPLVFGMFPFETKLLLHKEKAQFDLFGHFAAGYISIIVGAVVSALV